MIKELDGAILTTDLPEYGLQAGDVGTVVHVFGRGEAYIVEFMTLDGETIAVVELEADQVKPERGDSVPHARPLSLPRSTGDS
jgi:hypothetical protein